MNELKELPEGWKWVKFKDVCNIISGKNQTKVLNPDGKYPIYGSSGIFGFADEFLCNAGTTIVGRKGTINKPLFVNTKFWNVDTAFGLSAYEHYDNKLLYYFCLSFNFQKLDKSTTIPSLAKRDLLAIDIPLPPLPTQQAIVSKIEELFSELDKGVENLKTAQQQLKVYRQAVLKWAFEGKLTENWRTKNIDFPNSCDFMIKIRKEKERLLKLEGKKIKATFFIDEEEQNSLFELPKEWIWVRNEDYLYEVKDGTHDSPKYATTGIPFITQKNVREEGLDLTNIQFITQEDHDKFYKRSNVEKDDLLISMIGHNRGMTAIVNTHRIFSIKNVGLFKFNHLLQLNKFSFYYYQSKVGLNLLLKKSKGGAQPFIGLTELRNWPVIVCALEEQTQIVQEIEKRLSVADKMEESIQQSLLQAESLRQSILKKAFEGGLVK
jgi:type I restriction enzyme S subunit